MTPISTDVTCASTKQPLPGHVGQLTPEETKKLKQLWNRIMKTFEQKGSDNAGPSNDALSQMSTPSPRKAGFFGFGAKKDDTVNDQVFLGVTTDPSWMSLPLEKALPLIPGSLLKKTFWNMVGIDNPDAVLLRFLRARRWDLSHSFDMLVNTLRWRLSYRVDDITALGESGIRDLLEAKQPGMGDSFVTNLGSGKACIGGPDRYGRGICYINVRFHNKDDQSIEVVKLLTIYVMETSRLIVAQPVESVCIVFNMDGFSLSNMDYDFVKFLITCFEAYYPETLGSCVIHKAPWIFSTVWSVVKGLLDPVVEKKIHFTKSIDDLDQFVDRQVLPSFLTEEGDEKTKDEIESGEIPRAGKLDAPTTPAVQNYESQISQYLDTTLSWTESGDESVKDRQDFAKAYRLARIKAENDLRAPTRYHSKGLVHITEEDRLIVDFGTTGWTKTDITECV